MSERKSGKTIQIGDLFLREEIYGRALVALRTAEEGDDLKKIAERANLQPEVVEAVREDQFRRANNKRQAWYGDDVFRDSDSDQT